MCSSALTARVRVTPPGSLASAFTPPASLQPVSRAAVSSSSVVMGAKVRRRLASMCGQPGPLGGGSLHVPASWSGYQELRLREQCRGRIVKPHKRGWQAGFRQSGRFG
eukprot:2619336-Prymnesium_polylepis.1